MQLWKQTETTCTNKCMEYFYSLHKTKFPAHKIQTLFSLLVEGISNCLTEHWYCFLFSTKDPFLFICNSIGLKNDTTSIFNCIHVRSPSLIGIKLNIYSRLKIFLHPSNRRRTLTDTFSFSIERQPLKIGFLLSEIPLKWFHYRSCHRLL